jgi:hypothetical protein
LAARLLLLLPGLLVSRDAGLEKLNGLVWPAGAGDLEFFPALFVVELFVVEMKNASS